MTVPEHLDRRFRESAAAAGLLDAAYDLTTPRSGGCSSRGPTAASAASRTRPTSRSSARAHARIARPARAAAPRRPSRRELDEYFDGTRPEFDLESTSRSSPPFHRLVLDELARVPYGEVTTYGGLAARSAPEGGPGRRRCLNKNPVPIVLPCHRVVGASGSLVGYAGGLERKRALLQLEGALLA